GDAAWKARIPSRAAVGRDESGRVGSARMDRDARAAGRARAGDAFGGVRGRRRRARRGLAEGDAGQSEKGNDAGGDMDRGHVRYLRRLDGPKSEREAGRKK